MKDVVFILFFLISWNIVQAAAMTSAANFLWKTHFDTVLFFGMEAPFKVRGAHASGGLLVPQRSTDKTEVIPAAFPSSRS